MNLHGVGDDRLVCDAHVPHQICDLVMPEEHIGGLAHGPHLTGSKGGRGLTMIPFGFVLWYGDM